MTRHDPAATTVSRQQLEAAHCWEAADQVPGRPELTAFRRQLRYHQACWREARGYPIGSQPIGPPRPGGSSRLVGSRLALDHARETGANFLTPAAREAARTRVKAKEPHQSFAVNRLWADLLSAPALAFNLFGDLAADPAVADRAIHSWWPEVPGRVAEVRFAHSPGRLDPSYLGNLSAFDAAFALDGVGDGRRAIIGIVTRYHERVKREVPKPERLPRYRELAERSGAFAPGAVDAILDSDLLVMWLDHLLVLSMLQHPSGTWGWGRCVVVHPAGNSDHDEACRRYRGLLVDRSTYDSVTVEELLDAGALRDPTVAALRERYLPAVAPA